MPIFPHNIPMLFLHVVLHLWNRLWLVTSVLAVSLSVLIFALTGLLCSDKFPSLEISAEPAIQYNHMQTTHHLVQESEPLLLQWLFPYIFRAIPAI